MISMFHPNFKSAGPFIYFLHFLSEPYLLQVVHVAFFQGSFFCMEALYIFTIHTRESHIQNTVYMDEGACL